MSEFVNYDENGAYICFNSSVGLVIGRMAMTTMFTFNDEYRGVDHIFVATGETEDSFTGPTLFRVALENEPTMFDKILAEMRDEDFGEIVADVPHEADMQTFNDFIDQAFNPKVTNKKIRKWLKDE